MQVPYHIKVDLKEYYELYWSGKWEIPNFSEECLICKRPNCAKYLGIYTRTAICPILGFEATDLPILRFHCQSKKEQSSCSHITFSLLPLALVPYRQLTLKFMLLALYIRLSRRLSLFAASDVISEELINLADIGDFLNISTQLSWEVMAKFAFNLFIKKNVTMPVNSLCTEVKSTDRECLVVFLSACIKHKSYINNDPIRGPDGFAWDFYFLLSQETSLPPYLFGTASQHRNLI